MALGQQLLRRFERRAVAGRIYSRLEITGRGLTLGAETVLAGVGRNARGPPRLALDDEPRVVALLSTAYGKPVKLNRRNAFQNGAKDGIRMGRGADPFRVLMSRQTLASQESMPCALSSQNQPDSRGSSPAMTIRVTSHEVWYNSRSEG